MTHFAQRSLYAVLVWLMLPAMAGCGWKAVPMTRGADLALEPDVGVAVGRFDAGPTVGTVDAPPQDPVVLQWIQEVSGGAARKFPLQDGELASDFYILLPAGRYRLTRGRADTGFPDGHSLRTSEWSDTGIEFDVVAGEVTCVGEVVGTRHRGLGSIIMAALTRGGASYSFETRETCPEIEARYEAFVSGVSTENANPGAD